MNNNQVQEQIKFEVDDQCFYHVTAKRYITILDEPCFEKDKEFLTSIRSNLLKDYIPAAKVTVTLDDTKGDYCQWVAFLTSELRSDFKYREFEPICLNRKTDKIKVDYQGKAKTKMDFRHQFDEQIFNAMKKLNTFGISVTCSIEN